MKLLKLIIFLISLSPTIVLSDTIIDQEVTTEIDTKKSVAKYHWIISKNKFRLDISSPKGKVQYIFNGKNFYVCSRITKELMRKVSNFKIRDKSIIDKIKNGSCQAVPANFMARFFLSPAGAISTLDYSDGMQLTLGMEKYKFKKEGMGKTLASDCQNISRDFTVTRKINAKIGNHQKITEKICISKKYDWRKSFWKQISRNLIRQPSAKGLYKSLKKDLQNVPGFVLSSIGTFEKRDAKDKLRKGKRTTVTKMIRHSVKVAKKEFRTPTNYSIIDIHSTKFADSNDKKKDYEIEKDPIPVFLYYVLGGIL